MSKDRISALLRHSRMHDIHAIHGCSGFVAEPVILEWHRAHALAGGREQCIAQRRDHPSDRRLADAPPETAGGHDDGFDFWRRLRQPQYRVVGEVALHHAPVLDGDFLVHDGAQAPDDGALHLRLYRIRMDDVTAVDGDDHALYFDHVATLHRNLDHCRGEAAIGVHHRDAAVNA